MGNHAANLKVYDDEILEFEKNRRSPKISFYSKGTFAAFDLRGGGGVPDSGCPPVPAGQPRPYLVNVWPNFAKSP